MTALGRQCHDVQMYTSLADQPLLPVIQQDLHESAYVKLTPMQAAKSMCFPHPATWQWRAVNIIKHCNVCVMTKSWVAVVESADVDSSNVA